MPALAVRKRYLTSVIQTPQPGHALNIFQPYGQQP